MRTHKEKAMGEDPTTTLRLPMLIDSDAFAGDKTIWNWERVLERREKHYDQFSLSDFLIMLHVQADPDITIVLKAARKVCFHQLACISELLRAMHYEQANDEAMAEGDDRLLGDMAEMWADCRQWLIAQCAKSHFRNNFLDIYELDSFRSCRPFVHEGQDNKWWTESQYETATLAMRVIDWSRRIYETWHQPFVVWDFHGQVFAQAIRPFDEKQMMDPATRSVLEKSLRVQSEAEGLGR